MSVRANERNQGELTVIVKAKEMAAHTLSLTNNEKVFPKRYRLTLTNKIVDKAFEVYTLLYEANEIYPHNGRELEMRQNKQRQAMAYCRSMMAMIDIAKETFNLSADKVAYWAKMIFEVRSLAAAWARKDADRFKDKF